MSNASRFVINSWVEPQLRGGGRSVVFGWETAKGIEVVQKFTVTHHEDGPGMAPEPTLDGVHGRQFLQGVLDHAWAIGMRPLNYQQETTEQVAAMSAHLADMRALVFVGKLEPRP